MSHFDIQLTPRDRICFSPAQLSGLRIQYCVLGYVYMNGDVGKLPSGAVYTTTTPDTGAPIAALPDYCVAVNGVAEGAEGLSPMSPSAPQDPSTYTLPQLKQMLSQQLEYYFSRYLHNFQILLCNKVLSTSCSD